MDFAPMLAAVALVWKAVDFVKNVKAADTNAAVTQVVVWAVGIGVAFLLVASDFANGIKVGGVVLGSLNAASTLLVGLSLGSTASVAVDVKKAVDQGDSAKQHRLLGGE